MPYNEDTRIVLADMMRRLREEKKVSEQLLSGLQNLIEEETFGDATSIASLLDGMAVAGQAQDEEGTS